MVLRIFLLGVASQRAESPTVFRSIVFSAGDLLYKKGKRLYDTIHGLIA
jgi:hypothetical protein